MRLTLWVSTWIGFPRALLDCPRLTSVTLEAYPLGEDRGQPNMGVVSEDFSKLSRLELLRLRDCGVRAVQGVQRLSSLKHMQVRETRPWHAERCATRVVSTSLAVFLLQLSYAFVFVGKLPFSRRRCGCRSLPNSAMNYNFRPCPLTWKVCSSQQLSHHFGDLYIAHSSETGLFGSSGGAASVSTAPALTIVALLCTHMHARRSSASRRAGCWQPPALSRHCSLRAAAAAGVHGHLGRQTYAP